jgi:CBS domain containing-hemolysin-like protein
MSEGWALALTAGLLLLNALFVAAEFALVAARRTAIEPRAETGSRRAAATLQAMEHVSLMMAGAQLGITVCSLGLGALSEPAIAHLLEPAFGAAGVPDAAGHAVAFALALALVTMLHVVIGEMVPKNATLAGPDRAAMWLGPPLALLVAALKPLLWVFNESVNLMLRAVRIEPRDEVASAFTRAEVAGLIAQSRREGLLDEERHGRLSRALSFDTVTIGDIAIPMAQVHCIDRDASVEDAERLAARTGVTRFPVRDGDALVGYLHLKDTLGTPPGRRAEPLPARHIRPLPELGADLPLPDALELMRDHRAPIAHVAADGASRGIATLDDVLARLVSP